MKISQPKLSKHHSSIDLLVPVLTIATKSSKQKIADRHHHQTSGFTLIELLMAMSIMAITATLISYAVSQMITSNQKLGQEQNRRVEVSRALDMIASDIKISKIDTSGRAMPTGATITGTVVLDMDVEADDAVAGTVGVSACTSEQRRIIYSVKPNSGEVGQSVIYRYGLISQADGKIHCASSTLYPTAGTLQTDNGAAIADAISIDNSTQTISVPTCGATAKNANGFYTCTKDNQVSIVIYTATQSVKSGSTYTNSKTYAIARNVVSGEKISPLSSTPELCAVPPLVGLAKSGTDGAEARITEAKSTTDTSKTLRSNAIRTEVSASGDTVTSQSPLAGNRLPCDGGLVTYTY